MDIIVHKDALEALIVSFRTARQTEFRHFVEQLGKISTKDLLDMRSGFQEETETYISALHKKELT